MPFQTLNEFPWLIHFFQRHKEDDFEESVPAQKFLDEIPISVAANLMAVLTAVSKAPPPKFSGGGKWEAMHGKMNGYYEIRVDGFYRGGRWHFRLFCILERNGKETGLNGPSIVIISGMRKKFGTTFLDKEYKNGVRKFGEEYLKRIPRSIAKD